MAELRKKIKELETENKNLQIHVQKLLRVKEHCLKNHDQEQGERGDSKEGIRSRSRVRSRSRSPLQRRPRSPVVPRSSIKEEDTVIVLD